MKYLVSVLLFVFSLSSFGQPLLRNPWTTTAIPGTTNWASTFNFQSGIAYGNLFKSVTVSNNFTGPVYFDGSILGSEIRSIAGVTGEFDILGWLKMVNGGISVSVGITNTGSFVQSGPMVFPTGSAGTGKYLISGATGIGAWQRPNFVIVATNGASFIDTNSVPVVIGVNTNFQSYQYVVGFTTGDNPNGLQDGQSHQLLYSTNGWLWGYLNMPFNGVTNNQWRLIVSPSTNTSAFFNAGTVTNYGLTVTKGGLANQSTVTNSASVANAGPVTNFLGSSKIDLIQSSVPGASSIANFDYASNNVYSITLGSNTVAQVTNIAGTSGTQFQIATLIVTNNGSFDIAFTNFNSAFIWLGPTNAQANTTTVFQFVKNGPLVFASSTTVATNLSVSGTISVNAVVSTNGVGNPTTLLAPSSNLTNYVVAAGRSYYINATNQIKLVSITGGVAGLRQWTDITITNFSTANWPVIVTNTWTSFVTSPTIVSTNLKAMKLSIEIEGANIFYGVTQP